MGGNGGDGSSAPRPGSEEEEPEEAADGDGDGDDGDGWDNPQELVGYLEDPPSEAEKRVLTRQFFPSKIGGRPAWLVPEHLPDADRSLACQRCGARLRFLMQVYASQGTWRERAFHRVLHLFVCTHCQPNEARVFRAQLPRDCPYYSPERPDEEAARTAPTADPDAELEALCCPSCGLPPASAATSSAGANASAGEPPAAPGPCTECARRARYGDPPAIFAERELSVDDAASPDSEEDEAAGSEDGGEQGDEAAEQEGGRAAAEGAAVAAAAAAESAGGGDELAMVRLKEYQERVAEDPESALDGSERKVYEDWCNERSVKDPAFAEFQRFSAENPKHVVRYELGGKPLWFCEPGQLTAEPPPCGRCGGPRVFEFQVQPQLIALISGTPLADRLDFGTLCIFACKESCNPAEGSEPYFEEFIHVQPEPVDEWIPPA